MEGLSIRLFCVSLKTMPIVCNTYLLQVLIKSVVPLDIALTANQVKCRVGIISHTLLQLIDDLILEFNLML